MSTATVDVSSKIYLLADFIGLAIWETVVIVRKSANYDYSECEGNEQMLATNKTGPLPAHDRIPARIGEQPTTEMVKPVYPVIEYPHTEVSGDAIANGFVYTGSIVALRGKYIFGDIRLAASVGLT